MGLVTLIALVYLAHLSAATTCPQHRPLTARQSCNTNQDCSNGKTCCDYSDSKFCVYTDPNTCISEGKVVNKGESITLKDNCSTCDCQGFGDLICTNDACVWPKLPQADNFEAAYDCPRNRPLTAWKQCRTNRDCQAGKSCCFYSGSNFCVSTDPNTCTKDGRIVQNGEQILLKDQCTSCTCRGYDDLICTNDGCIWPKRPLKPAPKCPMNRPLTAFKHCTTNTDCSGGKSCCPFRGSKFCVSTDPNTCVKNGRIIRKDQTITLKDGCSTCTCRGYDFMPCTNDGCYWPKQLPTFVGCNYGGRYFNHGSSFPASDGCNTCYCANGRVLCTLKGCYGYGFNRFFR